MTQRPSVVRTVGWMLAGGVWVFAALALWSFSVTDWPSHASFPYPPAHNWCGFIGAWTAYQLYAAVGQGAWAILAATGLLVLLRLLDYKVRDLWLRAAGLALLTVAVAAVFAELGWNLAGMPEGDGGVFGIASAGYLRQHFGVAGTRLALILACLAGVLLVADELVVTVPARMLGFARQVRDDVAKATAKKKPVEVKVPAFSMPKLSLPRIAIPRFRFTRAKPKPAPKKRLVTVGIDDAGPLGDRPPIDKELSDEIAMEDAVEEELEEDDSDEDSADEAGEAEEEQEPAVPAGQEGPPKPRDLSQIKVKLPSNTRIKRTAPPPPKELGEYQLPDWEVLDNAETGFAEQQEAFVRAKAAQLEAAFEEFGVDAHVVEIDTGPVITVYEISVARGTKVSSI